MSEIPDSLDALLQEKERAMKNLEDFVERTVDLFTKMVLHHRY